MKSNSGSLPKGFVLAKPIAQEGYDESVIYKLEREGRLMITRKRDGWKMFAVVGKKHRVRLFTDGLNEIDSRFDHIRKDIERLKLPEGTVLVGEAIVDLEGSDDLTKVISIFHSNTEKSLRFQKENGMAKYMIFAAMLPENEEEMPYSLNHNLVLRILSRKPSPVHVFAVPVLNMSFDNAKKLSLEKNWEGLVLYDRNYRFTYRTDGKAPKRPLGCYKWKPIWEDDFIVREWILRPDAKDTVKELVLVQIDPVSGQEFYCGKLGSFTDKMRKDLTKMRFPLVVQAAFEMRFAKTGKIRNARFVQIRTDKPVDQCIAPRTYPQSEYS